MDLSYATQLLRGAMRTFPDNLIFVQQLCIYVFLLIYTFAYKNTKDIFSLNPHWKTLSYILNSRPVTGSHKDHPVPAVGRRHLPRREQDEPDVQVRPSGEVWLLQRAGHTTHLRLWQGNRLSLSLCVFYLSISFWQAWLILDLDFSKKETSIILSIID